jgi:hypothetical protein
METVVMVCQNNLKKIYIFKNTEHNIPLTSKLRMHGHTEISEDLLNLLSVPEK